MKKTKSNPRGAGRPKLGKVRLVLKVQPETRKAIDAAKGDKSRGEVVDELFARQGSPA